MESFLYTRETWSARSPLRRSKPKRGCSIFFECCVSVSRRALNLRINRMRVVHARLTEESELPVVHHSCSMSFAGRPDGVIMVEEVPQLSARDVV